MSEMTPTPQFEEEVCATVATPMARQAFVQSLYTRLIEQAGCQRKTRRVLFLHPARVSVLIATILLLSILLIGPKRLVAAMSRWIGYLPGVGVVDQSAPIRVLAEPVSLTREGITVSVNSATLTASQTYIEVGVSGVPLSAYPKDEAISGCTDPSYLRLADGERLDVDDVIPADVNEAVYVMPCIFHTLPGTVPTDWELLLRFIPVPPDLTVIPIVDVAPTTQRSHAPSPPSTETGTTETVTPVPPVTISVEKVIETDRGYILIGVIRSRLGNNQHIQVSGIPTLWDAQGHKVEYTYPSEIDPYEIVEIGQDDQPFLFQIDASGIVFPLTIEIPGKVITPAEPNATTAIFFEAGAQPRPGQEWVLNQEIELAGHTFTLVSITTDGSNGYAFRFKADEEIAALSVAIEGHTPIGGGGGSDGQEMINQSLSYTRLPTGNLKLIFSDLMLASDTQFWRAQWQPEILRNDWPTATPATFPVCLDAEGLSQVQPLPEELTGTVLLTEIDSNFRLVLAELDGSNRRVLAEQIGRGAFSPDGQKVAYAGKTGIVILNLATGLSKELVGVSGYDLRWSPDSKQIAYVTGGDTYGLFVISVEPLQSPRPLSNLGYEALAGWSPDSQWVYYAIPSASGEGFLLRAVEIATNFTRDLFILDDSSRKAPLPRISPDGRWVVYRASNNSSIYLKAMDGGSSARLLMDNPGLAINGIAWGKTAEWLGFSVITREHPQGILLLLRIDGCEVYLLPGLLGEIRGLLFP